MFGSTNAVVFVVVFCAVLLGVELVEIAAVPHSAQIEDSQWQDLLGLLPERPKQGRLPISASNPELENAWTQLGFSPLVSNRNDWTRGISATAGELFQQFDGFLPYLRKLMGPLVKVFELLFDKGKGYFVEYVRTLPPDTVQRIQMKTFELLTKVFGFNLIRTLSKIFFGPLI